MTLHFLFLGFARFAVRVKWAKHYGDIKTETVCESVLRESVAVAAPVAPAVAAAVPVAAAVTVGVVVVAAAVIAVAGFPAKK